MLMSLGVVGLPLGLLRWHGNYFLWRDDSKRKSFFYRNDGHSIFRRWSLVEVSSVDDDFRPLDCGEGDNSCYREERRLE
jgi:hypothetical protein